MKRSAILNRPICRDVLHSEFDHLNAPAGYDPDYNYVGSDWLQRHWGIGLERHFCGADINRAAWIHDCDYGRGISLYEWDRANDAFRDNVVKLIAAAGHPIMARIIGWFHWLGVESIPALIDYWLCRKER